MLDGSPAHSGEANIGNVENNNPVTGSDGLNTGNKAKQAILKKGAKKLRHKPPRNSVNIRLTDNNNNSVTASTAAQLGTEPPAGTEPALSLHHLKQEARKELLKSKGGRLERGVVLSGGQPSCNLVGLDQITRNVNVRSHKQAQSAGASHAMRRKDNSSPNKPSSLHQPALREQKKPLHASNNVKILNALPDGPAFEYLKDGEKVYAGAKFSEPPSPSVLPKPPSHWVGENEPQRSSQSREQMSVHLKSLLKVQDKV